jgi:hypothetical protein
MTRVHEKHILSEVLKAKGSEETTQSVPNL